MSERKRRRAFAPRARTGCRTCRIRHVRCDEAPGSCYNCSSTGRKCDGYDQTHLPLATARSRKSIVLQMPASIATNLRGMTPDERRGFAFFLTQTVPMITSCFNSDVWQRLVLQMSQADPAVGHAVVALSAMHQDTQLQHITLHHSPLRRFALEQYNRAISMLHTRLPSNDPQLRGVVLMCCFVFVTLELLQGDYPAAMAHLQNGLNILGMNGPRTDPVSAWGKARGLEMSTGGTEMALVGAFRHLQVQAVHFAPPGSAVHSRPEQFEEMDEQRPFHSLAGAKEALDPILSDVLYGFQIRCEFAVQGDATDFLTLSVERHYLLRRLKTHRVALEALVAQGDGEWSPRDLRCINIMRLHHTTLGVLLGTLLNLSEMTYDAYLAEFNETADLSERVVESLMQEYGGGGFPKMVMDMGVIPGLFWTFFKCRDTSCRRRILKILEAWPHREGPYESNLVLHVLRTHMEVECEGEQIITGADGQTTTIIPESRRVREACLEISPDRGDIFLAYRLSGDSQMQKRRVPMADENFRSSLDEVSQGSTQYLWLTSHQTSLSPAQAVTPGDLCRFAGHLPVIWRCTT
ncbi:Zn(II)2Cys6 transcription factor [Aspergillus ibericus CBS 121593]|uniref:Zn(2)-C6 fungal-type domain-containing protein n=1 Tax=Aspergillus ibericus CBS 121593 TaxID=1448316 RepID=A0A395GVQ1_9EURO|nr:hypothetical protein BO80DRAFT_426285 [Aspergillus ibericus CBS 121593]RAK99586.1 hypothetical protein BO80DRAFT_426285 [Aspergillus ibericus CBS 121593]